MERESISAIPWLTDGSLCYFFTSLNSTISTGDAKSLLHVLIYHHMGEIAGKEKGGRGLLNITVYSYLDLEL